MQKTLSSTNLKKMILVGAKVLEDNKAIVDSLNVFPVPDGDTGTNMSLTLTSAVNELNQNYENNWTSLANSLSRGALKGARGNSGVILSQILKGMSLEFAKVENEISTKQFAKALLSGADVAYKAVTKPKEGTILTVIKAMAESADKASKRAVSFEEFFDIILNDGEITLQQTPEMLPVLKKAGVVDAGGRGLLLIFAGMNKCLLGNEDVEIHAEEMDNRGTAGDDVIKIVTTAEHEHLADIENLGDIEFGYCTEFMVTHMKPKTTESDIDKLRNKLLELGDSVVCVGDLELVKVHVHTNEPNKALGYGLELGELINLKVDNMREQNRQLKKERSHQEENLKEFGMVAVAPGEGIASVFKEILVDNIIQGGQTMNPSAEDIAKACDLVQAKNVFVFPNNKNIILAAEQAKDLTKRTLHVVPTVSIPEGIASALTFSDEVSLEENFENMLSAKSTVVSASVTHAVRSTHVDGFDLKQGDIIGLDNKNIVEKGNLVHETTVKLIEKLKTPDMVNITLFYGKDIKESDAELLRQELETKYPECDVVMLNGAQPVYYYIISME